MAYSAFRYMTAADFAEHALSISGVAEANLLRFASAAERLIDAYCGKWPRFYPELIGEPSESVASGAVTIPTTLVGDAAPDYWSQGGVYLVTFDGTGAGQTRQVIASEANQLTLSSGLSAALDTTSRFVFVQKSVFPRRTDVYSYTARPYVPDAVKLATIYQVEWAITVGSDEFGLSDPALIDGSRNAITQETYGTGYSVSRDPGFQGKGRALLVAPKAQAILAGYVCSTGRLV